MNQESETRDQQSPVDPWIELWQRSAEAWQRSLQSAMAQLTGAQGGDGDQPSAGTQETGEGTATAGSAGADPTTLLRQWFEAVSRVVSQNPLAALAGMPGMSGFPGLGTMPGMPGFAAMPGMSAMPGFGAMPGMPGMPGFAAMPGFGGASGAAGSGGMPGMSEALEMFRRLGSLWSVPGATAFGGSSGARIPGWGGIPSLGDLGPAGAGPALFTQLGRWWLEVLSRAAQQGADSWQQVLRPERLAELQRYFTQGLNQLADQLAASPLGPLGQLLSGGASGLSGLLTQSAGLGQRLLGPWGASWRELSTAWQQALQGDREAFRHFVQTWKETYDATYGRLLQAPALGYSREPAERLNRSLDAFVDYLANVQELTAVLDRVGRQAIERFHQRLGELGADGEVPSHRAVYRLYIETFENSYVEVFRSREYSRLQGQMVAAGLRFKRRLDSALEDWLQFFPIPTDSEMRELYQAFHELRKTVRAQRGEIEALQGRLRELEQPGTETP